MRNTLQHILTHIQERSTPSLVTMEYEDFCRFTDKSPSLALKICHESVRRLIQRGTLDSAGEEAQIRTECEDTLESLRFMSVTRELLVKGFTMPPGMNAWHRQLGVFIRWLPGHEKPISGKVRDVLAQQTGTGWFVHRDLRVTLRWNEDGFYEMNSEDSRAFNIEHAENHWLLTKQNAFSNNSSALSSTTTSKSARQAKCAARDVIDLQDSESDFYERHTERSSVTGADSHKKRAAPPLIDTTHSSATHSGNTKAKHYSGSGGIFWTLEQDDKLAEAMQGNLSDWEKIAAHVGKSARSCSSRWYRYLSSAVQEGSKHGPWCTEEENQLRELVPQCRLQGAVYDAIDWKAISKHLKRTPQDCNNKWKLLATEGMVKGKFSPEEDGVIKRRVAEWQARHHSGGGNSSGSGKLGQQLWDSLQKELNRPAAAVEVRWNRIAKWM